MKKDIKASKVVKRPKYAVSALAVFNTVLGIVLLVQGHGVGGLVLIAGLLGLKR